MPGVSTIAWAMPEFPELTRRYQIFLNWLDISGNDWFPQEPATYRFNEQMWSWASTVEQFSGVGKPFFWTGPMSYFHLLITLYFSKFVHEREIQNVPQHIFVVRGIWPLSLGNTACNYSLKKILIVFHWKEPIEKSC
jgi:hypothetical protein